MSGKYVYKTKNGVLSGFIPGVGEIKDGKIESDKPLESSNLELVSNSVEGSERQQSPVVGTVSQQNPALNKTAGDQAPATNTGVTE